MTEKKGLRRAQREGYEINAEQLPTEAKEFLAGIELQGRSLVISEERPRSDHRTKYPMQGLRRTRIEDSD